MKIRFALSALLFAIASLAAPGGPDLPQIFQQAKEEFARGRYAEALETLARLEAASRQPGFERDQKQLEPVISFYRGASLAAMGKTAEGKEEFRRYLMLYPTASLEKGAFPSRVFDAFEATRLEVLNQSRTTPGSDIGTVYGSFRPRGALPIDASWIATPVRYLLDADEKLEWSGLETDQKRTAFIESFWRRHDPTPGTAENEFRAEMERRILFADEVFSSEGRKGSETDRALVFAFLGPPTVLSRAQIRSGQGAVEALRGRTQGTNLGRDHRVAGAGARTLDHELNQGFVETWEYRRGEVPKPLSFPDLKFEFITQKGYGDGVLQKDATPLQAIDMMVAFVAAELELE